MKRGFGLAAVVLLLLSSCGTGSEMINMKSTLQDEKYCIIWESRTYEPFCVVSKEDCGVQIGYVDGDADDRISEYKGYPPEEWLVSWMPMDGGAILLKEAGVVDIPDGLKREY